MTWKHEPPALNFGLERERPENSGILCFIHCVWRLVVQLFAIVQTVHRIIAIFLLPSTSRFYAVFLFLPPYILQDLSQLLSAILRNAYCLILWWIKLIEGMQTYRRQGTMARFPRFTGQLFIAVQAIYQTISVFLLSFTICRLYAVCLLLPIYILQLLYCLLPTTLGNVRCLILRRNKLIEDTETYRRQGAMQAQLQLEGKYVFPPNEVVRGDLSGKQWVKDIPWHDHIEEFLVCGARVRFIHLRPAAISTGSSGHLTKRPIVFLHGNRGWSYMWRKVMPKLLQEGHELFALDWLGHGLSDKPIRRESTTFELHIQTLTAFVSHVGLNNAILVAHHWGGCVALCTIPSLPSSSFSGLFLINSFLPPRPREMSVHSHILHGVWFLLTGILNGYVSQSTIARFISPHISEQNVESYGAPYQDLPANTRSSAERFARLAPGIPHFVLRSLRETQVWKLCEAVFDPGNFSDLNALALLSERDDSARCYWQKKREEDLFEGRESSLKTVVVFGERGPLLKDYKDVLVRVINKSNLADWAPNGIWLPTAGRYPMEDNPEDIAGLIARFS